MSLYKGKKMQEKTNFWGAEEFSRIFRQSECMGIIYISQNAIQVCEYTETKILFFLEIVNHWAFNTVTYTDQTQNTHKKKPFCLYYQLLIF